MAYLISTVLGLFNFSRFTAGFVAVLVGYTSSAVIIFQAAETLGASEAQTSSWLWALGIGMGLTSIGLSLAFKSPVLTAWSTPGAALLVTSLSGVSMSDAIGVFIFSSALIMLCGLTGWFDMLMRWIPQSLAGAMLAGVLLPFGVNVFTSIETQWMLAVGMLATYLVVKPLQPRYVIPITLMAGVLLAYTQDLLHLETLHFTITSPVWVTPTFNMASLIGVGIPFFIVTMTSQMMPGIAVMRANNYHTPASPLMTWTGVTGVIFAPFGGFSYNLAAITAAICMGKEADSDSSKRYIASIWAGLFYLFTGIFGATVASLFTAFPQVLVMSIAGLALLSTIGNSLSAALHNEIEREAALITFLVTLSGLSIMGIGSAFWGIVLGLAAFYLKKAFTK
ncbi:benzoate/H(+) symporter BenE family transporter [Neptunomonas phycophila]|uniref:benzoate/H(+) symporter BenE family transporter n=1 Tax=Neptunomonas phycophila TaxID=1572645 RepID=UPI0026E1CBFA|nr:benzoate/H(+) symporter BenE family transporter [Neptunomonas phycophila]MDO6785591.1 benzoate/H(+) symporter BenE family transporter [Neptunomonas phycophila]